MQMQQDYAAERRTLSYLYRYEQVHWNKKTCPAVAVMNTLKPVAASQEKAGSSTLCY